MRFLPISGLILALLACLTAMARARMPMLAIGYVFTLAGFAVIGARGLAMGVGEETQTYYDFYWTFLAGSLALSLVIACQFNFVHSLRSASLLVVGSLAQAVVVGIVAREWLAKAYGNRLPDALAVVLLQGMCMLIVGTLTLASLMAPHSPAAFALRFGLGVYWAGLGIVSFAFAFGIVRNRALWMTLNSFVPATLGIVVFAGLAIFFTMQQRELTRQPVAAHIEMEQAQ